MDQGRDFIKDETLYLYPLIIDSYRKLMSKYIELTNLTGEKYITKIEELKTTRLKNLQENL